MKIKTVVSFCKKNKKIVLKDGINNTQWLGDGCSLYPLLKMPHMTQENIYAFMEIPNDKKDAYQFAEDEELEQTYIGDLFADVADNEEIAERYDTLLVRNERTLQPLKTSKGIVFIDVKYLAPLSEHMEMLELYERTDANGVTRIVAKDGLILIAIITKCNVVNKFFIEEMQELTHLSTIALHEKESEGK